MKKICFVMGAALFLAAQGAPLYAEPSAEALRQTIRDHVAGQEKARGAFTVVDGRTGEPRRLQFVRVHERVGKTGDYYYSCTDMKDVKTNEMLDLDFDVEDRNGTLNVVDVRIHKDDGIPRYTYGVDDKRVQVFTIDLRPAQEGSSLSGKAAFIEMEEGLRISAVVTGASPGKHGFHVHEKGACGDSGNAAGGHFNPDGMSHGDLMKDGFGQAHAGDLGNIEIGPDGKGTFEKIIPGLTLKEGKYGVVGRSLILHEREDDFSQPTGNAGARIACGVIE
ncbi:MAG: superoxide dismutase family protein [Candidatus Omnitrophica bacterium]|nr:superoxide dismutase family protein [Candidatus Omnitrophota bacterium]